MLKYSVQKAKGYLLSLWYLPLSKENLTHSSLLPSNCPPACLIFSWAGWPFVCLLKNNVYLNPLLTFNCDIFLFIIIIYDFANIFSHSVGYLFISFFNPYPTTCVLILEKGEEKEKKRERNTDVRENHPLVAFHICPEWGPNPQPT